MSNLSARRTVRGLSIRDADGLNGSCSLCSEHYASLLPELNESRNYGAAVRLVCPNHVKNIDGIRSIGENRNARRRWLYSHSLDSDGNWIGHRNCIAELTSTHKETISNLRSVYREKSSNQRKIPAEVVLKDNHLLSPLVLDGPDETDNWSTLKYHL